MPPKEDLSEREDLLDAREDRLQDREDEIQEGMMEAVKKINDRINQIEDRQVSLELHHGDMKNMIPSSSDDPVIFGEDHIASAENRPQLGSAGLERNNLHFRDLSVHELQKTNTMFEKNNEAKTSHFMDQSLGTIADKCIHLLTYSFDNYGKHIYQAEIMEDIDIEKTNTFNKLKIYLIASILYIKEDENIIYVGILLILLSNIIYFTSIVF